MAEKRGWGGVPKGSYGWIGGLLAVDVVLLVRRAWGDVLAYTEYSTDAGLVLVDGITMERNTRWTREYQKLRRG